MERGQSGWKTYKTTIELDNKFEEDRMPITPHARCHNKNGDRTWFYSIPSVEACGKKCIAKGWCNKFSYNPKSKACVYNAPSDCKLEYSKWGWNTYTTSQLPPDTRIQELCVFPGDNKITWTKSVGYSCPSDMASCLNKNTPYTQVKDAWKKCVELSPECAYIMKHPNGKYYLRRATDTKNSGAQVVKLPCGYNVYESNKRCSNYQLDDGTWTRQWKTAVNPQECADKCIAAGSCNKFSFKDGVCLFNAPHKCNVESGYYATGWKTYKTRQVVQDKKSNRRLNDYRLPFSKEAFDRIKDIRFFWVHDMTHEMGCEMCRLYNPAASDISAYKACTQLCNYNFDEEKYYPEPIPARTLGDEDYMSGARTSILKIYSTPCKGHSSNIDGNQLLEKTLGLCTAGYSVSNYDKIPGYNIEGTTKCNEFSTKAAIEKACNEDVGCIGYTYYYGSPWCLKKKSDNLKLYVESNHDYYRKITNKQKVEQRPHHVAEDSERRELSEDEILSVEEFAAHMLQPHRKRPDFDDHVIDYEALGLTLPEEAHQEEVPQEEGLEEGLEEESKEKTVGVSLPQEVGSTFPSKTFMLDFLVLVQFFYTKFIKVNKRILQPIIYLKKLKFELNN